ncbi:MAG TPA: flagellar hook-length control protein FliK [Candidatus Polarisedimenticolia bacterium]|nr:flagellar hook-length control protein FliK [Candidatus Polarisedimenticolia bacterium]
MVGSPARLIVAAAEPSRHPLPEEAAPAADRRPRAAHTGADDLPAAPAGRERGPAETRPLDARPGGTEQDTAGQSAPRQTAPGPIDGVPKTAAAPATPTPPESAAPPPQPPAAAAARGATASPGASDGAVPLPYQALAQAIAERARTSSATGAVEVDFALLPADLGRVRVRIETRGQEIRIAISASSGSALEALAPGLSRLTSQLQEAGFRNPHLSLDLQGGAGPAPQQHDPDESRQSALRSGRAPYRAAGMSSRSRAAAPGSHAGALDRIA